MNMSMFYLRNTGNRNSQTGLAAVEFIICLPALLMLAVLLIDVSRAFIQYTEINKALQNGVRYAVVDTYGTLDFGSVANVDQIKKMVVYGTPEAKLISDAEGEKDIEILKHIGVDDVEIILPTDESKEVTLSVNYTYVPIFSQLPFTNQSLSFNIGATAKMRTSP